MTLQMSMLIYGKTIYHTTLGVQRSINVSSVPLCMDGITCIYMYMQSFKLGGITVIDISLLKMG